MNDIETYFTQCPIFLFSKMCLNMLWNKLVRQDFWKELTVINYKTQIHNTYVICLGGSKMFITCTYATRMTHSVWLYTCAQSYGLSHNQRSISLHTLSCNQRKSISYRKWIIHVAYPWILNSLVRSNHRHKPQPTCTILSHLGESYICGLKTVALDDGCFNPIVF